jgi:hypothetical protein
MRKERIAALVIVIALLAVGLAVETRHGTTNSNGPCSPEGGSCTSSSTSTISAQTTTIATNPTNGLELRLFLNASSSSPAGVSIGAFADVYNPSPSTANVTSANDWVLPLGYDDGAPCGNIGQTVGFAIAQGYYTSSNVTAAKPLVLVNPAVHYSCALYFGYGSPAGDLFLPMSDSGTSYDCIGVSPCLTGWNATATFGPSPITITGYYLGSTLTSFSGGTYTVLAEDEWGALALAYFHAS